MSLRIVAISDTHSMHRQFDIPDGDLLIHAGDITLKGEWAELIDFDNFLADLPHKHKIIIAGNHDFCFEQNPSEARNLIKHGIYLQDELITIDGISIYGSPWQPVFQNWAFNLNRGVEIRNMWDLISPKTDILVTHGPPYGYDDKTVQQQRVGCVDLLEIVQLIKPRLHIFGHIHEDRGEFNIQDTVCVNASLCNEFFEPIHKPIEYEYSD